MFLGRVMPYKGLPLFVDTIEWLRAEGIAVEAGVFGEGPLGASAARLERLGAEVVNRWLTVAEIAGILQRYHAMILSHTEASQSGVAAAALGAGLPIVATPVGGLGEQISDGVTGMMATHVDAAALGAAVLRLTKNPTTYHSICSNIAKIKDQRSMARFVRMAVAHAAGCRQRQDA